MPTTYFPQLTNSVTTQFPYTTTHMYATLKNDLPAGNRTASSLIAGGLSGFPTTALAKFALNYPNITDADLATLKAHFDAMDGSLNSFIFLDPGGNLVQYSELFSDASWTKNGVTVGSAYADPFGGTRATVLTATTTNSNLVTTVLPLGSASGITLTGTVWVNAVTGGQTLSIGFIDSGFSVLGSQTLNVPVDQWTRISFTYTLATSSYIRLLIGGFGTWNSTAIRLFGAQVSPLAGPGAYALSPAFYGYRPNCRLGVDEFTYRKLGPNQNSLALSVWEFAP